MKVSISSIIVYVRVNVQCERRVGIYNNRLHKRAVGSSRGRIEVIQSDTS